MADKSANSFYHLDTLNFERKDNEKEISNETNNKHKKYDFVLFAVGISVFFFCSLQFTRA